LCEAEIAATASGYMDRSVKEGMGIKLYTDFINPEEEFKLGKAWDPSNSLLRHSKTHTSQKSQEDTEKRMQKKK
jgi:hypothetical protein